MRTDDDTMYYNWIQGGIVLFQAEMKRSESNVVPFDVESAMPPAKNSCDGFSNHPYPGANYSDFSFDHSFNGVWEGIATNYMPIEDPAVYPIKLTLDVSPGCGRNCGRIEYPYSNLSAPVVYAMPIDCVMVLPPPPTSMPPLNMSTGRCFQFVEDFASEQAVGNPGGAQYVLAAFSVISQADGTLQWCYMQLTSCVSTSNLRRVLENV